MLTSRGLLHRSMRVATITTTMVVTLVMSQPGSTAPVARRSPQKQAKMYARVINTTATGPIQVLNDLCNKADPSRHCIPAGINLQNALLKRADVALTWVDSRQPGGDVFWTLSPIRFASGRAHFTYRWSEPPPNGCQGKGFVRFRWGPGGWHFAGSPGSVGCP